MGRNSIKFRKPYVMRLKIEDEFKKEIASEVKKTIYIVYKRNKYAPEIIKGVVKNKDLKGYPKERNSSLKEFIVEGQKVMARTEKSALKKILKTKTK